MKRKIIFYTIVIILFSCSVGYALKSILNDNNAVSGRYTAENGVIIKSPDEADRTQIRNSFDPETDIPTEIFKPKAIVDGNELPVKTIEIKLETKNWSENLKFDFYEKDGKKFVINNTEKGYSIEPFINTGEYILDYHNNLYLLDINKANISMLLKDNIDGYDFFSEEFHDKVYAPVWGEKPVISLDKTKMIFYTNRNLFFDDNGNGEIWIKDLVTGNEKKMGLGGYSYISTGSDECAYIQQQNKIVKVDFKNEDISIVFDKAYSQTTVKYPYVIYFETYRQLNIYNIETKEESIFKCDNLGAVRKFVVSDNDKRDILLTNVPNRESSNRSIIAINPETLSYKELIIPDNTRLIRYSWIDDNQITVTTKKLGDRSENTYMVNLAEIETQEFREESALND
jgi:hypothetical protein